MRVLHVMHVVHVLHVVLLKHVDLLTHVLHVMHVVRVMRGLHVMHRQGASEVCVWPVMQLVRVCVMPVTMAECHTMVSVLRIMYVENAYPVLHWAEMCLVIVLRVLQGMVVRVVRVFYSLCL